MDFPRPALVAEAWEWPAWDEAQLDELAQQLDDEEWTASLVAKRDWFTRTRPSCVLTNPHPIPAPHCVQRATQV